MSKKTVSAIMMFLLVISTSTLAFKIQSVKADSGTIYIQADGSIDPPTAPISTVDNVTYFLTDSINGSIVAERSNITIDGEGYTLQGSGGGCGFNLTSIDGVTIRNTNIRGFQIGVFEYNSLHHTLSENNITANSQYGVESYFSPSSDIVDGNNVTGNGVCDLVYRNEVGGFPQVEIINNAVGGVSLLAYDATVCQNNITGGISVSGFNGTANGYANISQNNIMDGINIGSEKSSADVTGNDIQGNINVGGDSASASISKNNIKGSIMAREYSSLRIFANNITTNYSGTGICLNEPLSTNIFENNIRENEIGISIQGTYNLSSHAIYHNNFINNTHQVGNATVPGLAWDNGYPSGGNYWSDYNGTDSNYDGIGDTPYIIDANNTDNYPLTSPWAHSNLVGDLNGDGEVSLQDLQLLALVYKSKLGDSNWNPLADLAAPYGIISLTDLVTMATHYGQHNP